MSILDTITNVVGGIGEFLGSDIGKTATTVGGGIYDIYQANRAAGQYDEARERLDPFGGERGFYQGKLRELFQDPSSLQNLPGYQFAFDEAMRAGTRQATKTGHYLSSNLPKELQRRAAGLASQTYFDQSKILAQLGGAGIGPGDLIGATGMGAGERASIGGTVTEALGTVGDIWGNQGKT